MYLSACVSYSRCNAAKKVTHAQKVELHYVAAAPVAALRQFSLVREQLPHECVARPHRPPL
eukprot:101081-Pyramimonas_sp.AAC.2